MNKKTYTIIMMSCVLFMIVLNLFTTSKINSLQSVVENSTTENQQLKMVNEELKKNNEKMQLIINKSEEKINDYKARSLIDYHPTLKEVQELLKENKINDAEYNSTEFNCVEFSHGLVKAFLNKGYYACTVELVFPDGAHALVAVDTEDRGVIYIEPQNDEIMFNLEIEDDYCEKAEWYCENEEENAWKIVRIKSCFDDIEY